MPTPWPSTARYADGMRRTSYALLVTSAVACVAILWGNTVAIALESRTPSRSLGTKASGRLERGKRLPTSGPNFVAYSRLGAMLGRNSLHSVVRDVVVEAYRDVDKTRPGVTFVYGEMGWPSGGRFRPHRTHQNGLSADFMVPLRNASGQPVRLPIRLWNRFGYNVELDSTGRSGNLAIDYDAIAVHLAALERRARQQGSAIELVIFAPELERILKADPRRRQILGEIPFMRGRPWVRHDEHYHVDFAPPRAASVPR